MIGKNNPLNIRTSSAFTWNGQTGATKGFCDFEDVMKCRRVGAYLLMRSYRKAGCKTIETIIRRWAPSNENDTEGYIKFVCKTTEFKPTMKLVFDSDFAAVLAAMEIIEKGVWQKERETYFANAKTAYISVINQFKIKCYEV